MSTRSKQGAGGEHAPEQDTREGTGRRRISRRGWTVVFSFALVVLLALLGSFVRVPYVGLGPGPTFDVLGTYEGSPVVAMDEATTYKTTGELRMTTVSVQDDVTLFGALGLWVSGRYALAPREQYFQPGQTEKEVERQNLRQFRRSQSAAETAALRELGKPIRVLVGDVRAGTAAAKQLQPGDRMLEVAGRTIDDSADMREALADTRPGQRITLTFQRDGTRMTERVRLSEPPEGATEDRGYIGFEVEERAEVPFDIDIELHDVGGPSAGLMFALAIVDRLTSENLTGGKHIAGTGEINSAGDVGAIGGIGFKLTAAEEAGAKAFLVPERNCAEARETAPDGLRLIKVSTLSDAVEALSALRAGRPVPSC